MKSRLLGLALLCGASVCARADAEHDRIVRDRAAANARFTERVSECETRFIVAPCLAQARNESRATIARLRQEELKLDEARRLAAAQERRKAIAEKAEAQQSRASDASPEAPRVRMRREPPVPAGPGARVVDAPTPATLRPALEQRSQARFDARARQAQAHRDAVARRDAQRGAQGKVAAPLPVPFGASAPR